jgi:phosphoribosylformylglycinamidine (FGAM) synthase-like enzyme
LRDSETRKPEARATLFNESQSRIIISVTTDNLDQVIQTLADIPHQHLGTVGGDELTITLDNSEFRWPVAELHDLWFHSIERAVGGDAS